MGNCDASNYKAGLERTCVELLETPVVEMFFLVCNSTKSVGQRYAHQLRHKPWRVWCQHGLRSCMKLRSANC